MKAPAASVSVGFLLVVCTAPVRPVRAQPQAVGSWDAPVVLPVVAVHAALLPTGKVLAFSFPGSLQDPQSYVCDPATAACAPAGVDRPLFCSGHALLADGRLMVIGGRAPGEIGGRGIRDTHVFDPFDETWTRVDDMAQGRWYPTGLTLSDGSVAAVAGDDETGVANPDVETYEVGAKPRWRLVAEQQLPTYPWLHVLASGDVFYSGPSRETGVFSADTWTPYGLSSSNYGGRGGGLSLLLPGAADRVMIVGGNDAGVVTATAEIIDLSDPSPAWRYTQPMSFARMHANAVILPDGTVLVVGGHSEMHGHDEGEGGGAPPPSSVYEAELFDPATETWTVMAATQVARVYHSTALLLPDARVVTAGSTDIGPLGRTAEIYSPPYLFRGPRPAITSAPARVTYAESFAIGSAEASEIASVVLIRLSSVTHSLNTDQRHVALAFTNPDGASDTLLAEAPSNPGLAPPGYYMLFLLDSDGVPSIASMIHLGYDGGALDADLVRIKPARSLSRPRGKVTVKGELATVVGEDFAGTPKITVEVEDALGFAISHTWTLASEATERNGRLKCESPDGNFTARFGPPKGAPAVYRLKVKFRRQAIDAATQLAGPVSVGVRFGPPPPADGPVLREADVSNCRMTGTALRCKG